MKRLFTIIAAVLLTANLFSQSPQKMSYQAVIRNSSDQLVTSHAVGIRVSILLGSETGTEVYKEIYNPNPQTNANGLVTIEIGGGIPLTGTFAGIDWSAGSYFIKTETDPTGGTSYTITGTSQLLSVPYALYAKTVANYPETDPVFGAWNKSTGINITASQVSDFQTNVTNNAAMLLNTAKNSYPTTDQTKLAGIATGANVGVVPNTGITGATKTKITYDTKGLVTSGTDATTADIAASTNKNYVTDAQLTVISNTSGTNTGDNATNTLYSGLVTNATHTGDVTGSGALTLANVNSNVGTFNNITINAKGLATAGSNVSYLTSETDPTVKAINGIVKSNGTTISAAIAADFPILNQNTTGNAATATTAGAVTEAAQPVITSVGTLTNLVVSGTTTVITPVNATNAVNKAYVDELKAQIEELQVVAGIRIKDIDGNVYKIVTIGTQIWMSENLKTTKYNNGTNIPNVTDNGEWISLSTGAYCWQNNDIANCNIYGALYNWYTVNMGNLCPTGWHVPTYNEWITLETFLGGTSVAGGKLKETGTAHWFSPNTSADNSSGFTALPGGVRQYSTGNFIYMGDYGYWWSSTENNTTDAWSRYLNSSSANIYWNYYKNYGKRDGLSVRCVKD